jgi:hypothetical protein
MLGQLLVAIAVSVVALPRVQDEALRDRVGGLLERLLGDDAAARDSAEDALRKLGPRVLPLLPDTATAKDADRKARLERLRADLRTMRSVTQRSTEADTLATFVVEDGRPGAVRA